jgi:hypothetical protein
MGGPLGAPKLSPHACSIEVMRGELKKNLLKKFDDTTGSLFLKDMESKKSVIHIFWSLGCARGRFFLCGMRKFAPKRWEKKSRYLPTPLDKKRT